MDGRQRRIDGEQDQPGADGVGAVASPGDVDPYTGVAQALPGQQGIRFGGRVLVAALGAGRVERAAVGGLQAEGIAGEDGEQPQHLGGAPAAQQHVPAAAQDLVGPAQQRVVAVDDLGVDGLGDRDVGDLAVQLDQRQTALPGAVDHRRGQRVESRAELHDESGDLAVGELTDEGALVRRPGAQPQAGGQQQLTALEQRGDMRHLARMDPAHRPVQPVLPGQDLRQPTPQRGQLQCPAYRDLGVDVRFLCLRPHGDERYAMTSYEDSRTTSRAAVITGASSSPASGPAPSRRSRSRAIRRPISSTSCRTVVSGGSAQAAGSRSS